MKRSVAIGVLLGGVFALIPVAIRAQAEPPAHLIVTPSDLEWTDVPSLPGAKLAVIEGPLNETAPFTMRIKLPAHYKIPAHRHPAIEHVTVISGTFNLGMGDKLDTSKTTALTAGSALPLCSPRPTTSRGHRMKRSFRCTASDRGRSIT
jgi:quercetin dioxygenase-like cupin family protein